MYKVDLLQPLNDQRNPWRQQVGGEHYKFVDIQPAQFCMQLGLPGEYAAVIKYVCRHHRKGGRHDLEKAAHYIRLIIWEFFDGPNRSNCTNAAEIKNHRFVNQFLDQFKLLECERQAIFLLLCQHHEYRYSLAHIHNLIFEAAETHYPEPASIKVGRAITDVGKGTLS